MFLTYELTKNKLSLKYKNYHLLRFSFFKFGQSLSLKVTVSFKLLDETLECFLAGVLSDLSLNRLTNHDSFWLYRIRVSINKRNHIENEVMMVATESQTILTWALFMVLLLRCSKPYNLHDIHGKA